MADLLTRKYTCILFYDNVKLIGYVSQYSLLAKILDFLGLFMSFNVS